MEAILHSQHGPTFSSSTSQTCKVFSAKSLLHLVEAGSERSAASEYFG